MSPPLLEVEGLTAGYGPVLALDGVSLEVRAGSITAVLGANGAGKTTLLRTISGLMSPRRGTVRLDGHSLEGMAVEAIVRQGLSHVPEGRGVIAELTVTENLRLGALWRKDHAEALRTREEMYALLPPLRACSGRAAATLSGGERQMLSIARAMMSHPRVLLLDEPSLGLAPRTAAQINALIRKLADTAGLAVLLVEQNARSALAIADAGVVLNLGRTIAQGPAAELAGNEELRRAYLGV